MIPLRATLGYGFADRGIYASITDWSWKTLEKLRRPRRQAPRQPGAACCRSRLSPHAPYSCGAEMYKLVREVADAHKVPIHTHLAEGPQEIAYVAETYGTSPVRWLHSLGFLEPDVTAAHCTQLDDDDARVLGRDRHRDRPLPLLQRQARLRHPAAALRARGTASRSAWRPTVRPATTRSTCSRR